MTNGNSYFETQSEYLVSYGERPWGYYLVLANEKDIKVKKITVKPNKQLSLQIHRKRNEHWFIHSGIGQVTLGDQHIELHPGDSINIKKNEKHRIANTTETDLVFIEIQTGEYFGEDDIERLDDDFGRD